MGKAYFQLLPYPIACFVVEAKVGLTSRNYWKGLPWLVEVVLCGVCAFVLAVIAAESLCVCVDFVGCGSIDCLSCVCVDVKLMFGRSLCSFV